MGVDGVPAAGEIDGLMSTVDPELAPAGAARAASQRATTAMTPKTVRPRERVEVRSATFPRSCCMRAWVDPGPKEHRRLRRVDKWYWGPGCGYPVAPAH